MSIFILVFIVLSLAFGGVLLFGAPYLPTLKRQREQALDLLDLSEGETMIELGSGDGGMLIEAAKRGIKSIGYEINPFLFVFSWIRARKYRDMISVKLANFWTTDLPKANGIYVFLLDKYMIKLDKKITQEAKGKIRLVSYTFKIPKKKTESVNEGLYLYIYNK